MKPPTELLPCPFCGHTSPWTFIHFSCAVLRCRCGAEMQDGSAQVMYQREALPPELLPFSYEPTLLVIQNQDGSRTPYPDHGYIGVNVLAAFERAGITARWNRRTP